MTATILTRKTLHFSGGRVAGAPVDCLNLRDIRSSRIIDRTAIIYETDGGRLYVNHRSRASVRSTNGTCKSPTPTARSSQLAARSSQLCSIDVVYVYDTGSRMRTGFVGLGKVVPYTKPEAQH